MDKMEFGNTLEGDVMYGISFSKEEICIIRKSLEERLKSLKRTIDRWSNPVFDIGEGLVNKRDLELHRERALRELKKEVHEMRRIESMLNKV